MSSSVVPLSLQAIARDLIFQSHWCHRVDWNVVGAVLGFLVGTIVAAIAVWVVSMGPKSLPIMGKGFNSNPCSALPNRLEFDRAFPMSVGLFLRHLFESLLLPGSTALCTSYIH